MFNKSAKESNTVPHTAYKYTYSGFITMQNSARISLTAKLNPPLCLST